MQNLEQRMASLLGGGRAVVIGVGNRLRGDDALGSNVARALRARGAREVYDAESVPENFLALLLESAPERALFVDLVDHGARPGVCCLLPIDKLPVRCGTTHRLSLCLMGRALETHGIECWLLGVQPKSLEAGALLSPEVAEAERAIEHAIGLALALPEAASHA